jgi:two-component system nitrogen regulation response regulator NtrX
MNQSKSRIIAVDDETNILIGIESCLESNKVEVDSFTSCVDAIEAMQKQVYDCALLDIRIGNENGIELFKQMLALEITIPVIFMSGNSSLREAAESQKLGAYDFIEKPFSSDKLTISVENCIRYNKLKNDLDFIQSNESHSKLIGEHSSMKKLKQEIAKVAKTDASVLIHGESGTGKELVAMEIHSASSRANHPLVTVNCSAIPENLVESALFGHKKGSFTGANEARKGYFEMAHKGTIFLDEIGDMPESSQVSLLRVLEAKEIQKIGSDNATKIDVRVIAATHKDLKLEVEKGNFRQDLFYRLSVIPIESPPLRTRLSDLEALVSHLNARLCKKHGIFTKQINQDCLSVFQNYDWPGNVRELTNTLERMIIMGGDELTLEAVPTDIVSPKKLSSDSTLKSFRARAERDFILQRLNQYNGNISQVARSLGIDRTNLHKKIKLYDIRRDKDFH